MKYAVTVREVYERTVIVEGAKDLAEAIDGVDDAVCHAEIKLGLDDFFHWEVVPSACFRHGEVCLGDDISSYEKLDVKRKGRH